MDTLSIQNGTRRSIPRVPFSAIKDAILGKKYQLSLVFVGDTRMRAMNRAHREKDATTDILSFSLTNDSGEIFISQKEAEKRSMRFHMTPREHLVFLFIHGCLHLKGVKHGRTMDRLEDSWCVHFGVKKPGGM